MWALYTFNLNVVPELISENLLIRKKYLIIYKFPLLLLNNKIQCLIKYVINLPVLD